MLHRSIGVRVGWLALLALGTTQTALIADDLGDRLAQLNVRERTDHYVLAGTVPDKRLEAFGRALEFIHREYSKGFSKLLSAERGKKSAAARRAGGSEGESFAADTTRFRVIIFKQKSEYLDFGRAFITSGTEHTRGMYIDAHQLLLILDQGNHDETFGILFHEAFHQFLARYVPAAPTWLNEGLATYYGTGKVRGGRLRFSQPRRDYWKIVRKLMTRKQTIALHDVINASHAQFYSRQSFPVSGFEDVRAKSVYYAEAYTLVHMMVNDRQGRTLLQGYIRALSKARGSELRAINERFFSAKKLAQIEPGWVRYVRSNPENGG